MLLVATGADKFTAPESKYIGRSTVACSSTTWIKLVERFVGCPGQSQWKGVLKTYGTIYANAGHVRSLVDVCSMGKIQPLPIGLVANVFLLGTDCNTTYSRLATVSEFCRDEANNLELCRRPYTIDT